MAAYPPLGLPQYGATPPLPPAAVPHGTLSPGTFVRVGQYSVTVDRFLSEGGFAHVYLVTSDTPLPVGSPAATTKHVLKRIAVPTKAGVEEVGREVVVMKALRSHPKIVNFLEASVSELKSANGTSKGYEIYILMEWCAGGGIIDMMNTRLQNRLTETEILKIFSDTVEAVAHMHYQSPPLIHRDLKVENILLAPPQTYKLCDFGSTTTPLRHVPTAAAELQKIEAEINKTTTLQYRAPELVDVWSRKGYDEKTDIWALGVFLYKLCYYTTPFEEHGPLAILNAQYKIPPYPAYSNAIKAMIAGMLQERPGARPNIYQLHEQVCRLRGTSVKLENKYASTSLTSSSSSSALPTAPPPKAFSTILSSTPLTPSSSSLVPDHHDLAASIAPMRRGRPPSKNPPPLAAVVGAPATEARMVRTGVVDGTAWDSGGVGAGVMSSSAPGSTMPSGTGTGGGTAGFGDAFAPGITTPSGGGVAFPEAFTSPESPASPSSSSSPAPTATTTAVPSTAPGGSPSHSMLFSDLVVPPSGASAPGGMSRTATPSWRTGGSPAPSPTPATTGEKWRASPKLRTLTGERWTAPASTSTGGAGAGAGGYDGLASLPATFGASSSAAAAAAKTTGTSSPESEPGPPLPRRPPAGGKKTDPARAGGGGGHPGSSASYSPSRAGRNGIGVAVLPQPPPSSGGGVASALGGPPKPELVSRGSQTSPRLLANWQLSAAGGSSRPTPSGLRETSLPVREREREWEHEREREQEVEKERKEEKERNEEKATKKVVDLLGDDEDDDGFQPPARGVTPATTAATSSATALSPSATALPSAPAPQHLVPPAIANKRFSMVASPSTTPQAGFESAREKFRPTTTKAPPPPPAAAAASAPSDDVADRFPALEDFDAPPVKPKPAPLPPPEKPSEPQESWAAIVEKEDDSSEDDDVDDGFGPPSLPHAGANRPTLSRLSSDSSQGGEIDLAPALASIRKFAPVGNNTPPPAPPAASPGRDEGGLIAPKPQTAKRQAAINSLVSRYEKISAAPAPPSPAAKPESLRKDSTGQSSTGGGYRAPGHRQSISSHWASPKASVDGFQSRFPDQSGLDTHLAAASAAAAATPSPPPAPAPQQQGKRAPPFKPVPPPKPAGPQPKKDEQEEEEKFVGVSNMRNRWETMGRGGGAGGGAGKVPVRKEWAAV